MSELEPCQTMDEVIAFLLGEGELDGCSFSEKPEHERGNFWWRKHLMAAWNHRPPSAREERLREALKTIRLNLGMGAKARMFADAALKEDTTDE